MSISIASPQCRSTFGEAARSARAGSSRRSISIACTWPAAAASRRVSAPSPAGLAASLRREGFDASPRTSAIGAVPAPADRPDLVPVTANRLMRDVVFLPAYPELGDDLARLARTVRQ